MRSYDVFMVCINDTYYSEVDCVAFTFSHAEWNAIYDALEGDRTSQDTVWDALNRSAPSAWLEGRDHI